MQITDALKRHGSEIGVVHPVQLLEEAILIEDRPR
jgi:Fe-S oxidoreductase